eukprot:5677558-Pleurochrysis_carterae.AAC.1
MRCKRERRLQKRATVRLRVIFVAVDATLEPPADAGVIGDEHVQFNLTRNMRTIQRNFAGRHQGVHIAWNKKEMN